MPFLSEPLDPLELNDRLHNAHAITAELFSFVISTACRRFPSAGQAEKTEKIERLVASQAWTDAVLALIDLELPQWQVRRIAYDDGEWYCALRSEEHTSELQSLV